MSDDITQQGPLDERYDLVGVRALAEYTTEALTRLLERGRRERCAAGQSEAEAYAAAELLAQLDPLAALNQLADQAGRSGQHRWNRPLAGTPPTRSTAPSPQVRATGIDHAETPR
jgi:hypothetical protein